MAPPAKFGRVPTSTSAESGYTHALAENVLLTLIILWELGRDATDNSFMLPPTKFDLIEVRTASASSGPLQGAS